MTVENLEWFHTQRSEKSTTVQFTGTLTHAQDRGLVCWKTMSNAVKLNDSMLPGCVIKNVRTTNEILVSQEASAAHHSKGRTQAQLCQRLLSPVP